MKLFVWCLENENNGDDDNLFTGLIVVVAKDIEQARKAVPIHLKHRIHGKAPDRWFDCTERKKKSFVAYAVFKTSTSSDIYLHG